MSDSEGPAEHAPCRHRRRETRNGVTMDWCYAIGAEELGDLPCEYCVDRKKKGVSNAEA